MKPIEPSSSIWRSDALRLTAVESVISKVKQFEPISESEFHVKAQESSYLLNPDLLVEEAVVLAQQAPYKEMGELLESNPIEYADTLPKLKMGRKILMIARDTIIINTRKDASVHHEPLRVACRLLGRLADTPEYNEQLINDTARALEDASTMQYLAQEYAITQDEISQKISTFLSTDNIRSIDVSNNPDQIDTYHKHRRDFRRVVNTYILAASINEDSHLLELASQGFKLNASYGNTMKAIDITT